MKPMLNLILAFTLTTSAGIMKAAPSNEESKSVENEKAIKTIEKAERTLDYVMENPVQGIPKSLINRSEGIVIFPGSCQIAAGAFNGPGGRGIAIIHNEDDTWSNPFFVTLREGHQGFQIGSQTSDIILLFKDRDDIISINKAEIALGSDVEVAPGPVNNGSSLSTDINFETAIYSYHRNKELFSGISLKGAIITYDKKPCASLYSIETINMDEIIYEIETPYNDIVNDLIAALNM